MLQITECPILIACSHQHDEGCQYCTYMSKVLDEFEQIIIDATFRTEEIGTDGRKITECKNVLTCEYQ